MSDTEKPILFSAPMVQAIFAGTKTQTRRVIKPQPDRIHDGEPYWYIGGYRAYQVRGTKDVLRKGTHSSLDCPYGEVGGLLWVRETWAKHKHFEERPTVGPGLVIYAADGKESRPVARWRPSIHMPRWASRIMLEITGVKVERVQDITEHDARAEGVEAKTDAFNAETYRWRFMLLWDALNKKRGFGWDKNLWVWCISFRRVKP